ncbi:MAG: hypothetical protein ACOCQR_03060 [bacterium]
MEEKIKKFYKLNDEMECEECGWWGHAKKLDFQDVPICPVCKSENIYEVTANMGS